MSKDLKAIYTSVQNHAEVTSVAVSGNGVDVKADARPGALVQSDYHIEQAVTGTLGELGFRVVGEWVQIAPEFPVFVEHDIDRLPLRAHRYEATVVKV